MEQTSLHPRISVNGISSWQWTIEQDIEFYRAARIGTIGVPFYKIARHPAAAVAAIQAAGLRCSSVPAGAAMGASLIAPPASGGEPEGLADLRRAIDASCALGSPTCYFTTGPALSRQPTDLAYDTLLAVIAPVNEYARAKGVRLAVENTSTATRDNGFIHTLADAVDLSRDAEVGIALELQNCWYERHLERLFKAHVDRFVVAQVSDFQVGEAARLNRRVPGDGDMPLEWMLGSLLDAGYQGLFEIEVVGPKIEEEGYPGAIRRSIDWLSGRLSAWGV